MSLPVQNISASTSARQRPFASATSTSDVNGSSITQRRRRSGAVPSMYAAEATAGSCDAGNRHAGPSFKIGVNRSRVSQQSEDREAHAEEQGDGHRVHAILIERGSSGRPAVVQPKCAPHSWQVTQYSPHLFAGHGSAHVHVCLAPNEASTSLPFG